MRKILLPVLLLATATGCAREPGFQPEEVLDWAINSYTITFDACTDSPAWREQFVDPTGASEPRRAVKISKDVLTATLLDCGVGSTESCTPVDPEVLFAVDGLSLRYAKTFVSDVEDSACKISYSQDILIEDRGAEMTETYVYGYALVGDEGACAELDAKLAARGTNGLGINGCKVTVVSEGVL